MDTLKHEKFIQKKSHDNGGADLSMQDDIHLTAPPKPIEYKLDKILSCVREDNLHGEYFFGESTGKETWRR